MRRIWVKAVDRVESEGQLHFSGDVFEMPLRDLGNLMRRGRVVPTRAPKVAPVIPPPPEPDPPKPKRTYRRRDLVADPVPVTPAAPTYQTVDLRAYPIESIEPAADDPPAEDSATET